MRTRRDVGALIDGIAGVTLSRLSACLHGTPSVADVATSTQPNLPEGVS